MGCHCRNRDWRHHLLGGEDLLGRCRALIIAAAQRSKPARDSIVSQKVALAGDNVSVLLDMERRKRQRCSKLVAQTALCAVCVIFRLRGNCVGAQPGVRPGFKWKIHVWTDQIFLPCAVRY